MEIRMWMQFIRLLRPEGTRFEGDDVILPPGAYCPFNSQNTLWWPEAFPLMYLPSYVAFRMTDIWRSLIAQRCLHASGQSVAFRSSTVDQVRNEHSLLDDFEDEISGYLGNRRIVESLNAVHLSEDLSECGLNMRRCYVQLVADGFIPDEELSLVDSWLESIG